MSERKGCLKKGCFGCLAVIALIVLFFVVMLVLGVVTGGGETRIETLAEKQPVPTVELPVEPFVGEDRPAELPRIPEGFTIDRPGRVELDLDYGEFEVVAGPPGSPIEVVGDYDAGKFKLVQRYEEAEDGSWVHKIRYDRKGVGFLINDDSTGRVQIRLPRQTPFELTGKIGLGESRTHLGGLWLLDVDLEFGTGEHTVTFEEPTAAPVPRVKLDSGIGVITVDDLGNASPSSAIVTHSVGETSVDLYGDWINDATIDIRCGIGECRVSSPDEVGLTIKDIGVMIGESNPTPSREAQPGEPTLELSVLASIGEVRVR